MKDLSLTDEGWPEPRRSLQLEAGEVHLWLASLSQNESALTSARALLSDDERERADRFRFERDRARYTVARAALRDILSLYLQTPAVEISFSYGRHGKPALSGEAKSRGLNFNLSHAGELALYAFTLDGAVGVDIERVRELEDAEGLAERFFSAEEVSVLKSLPAGQRAAAFFDCWTRKEAYVKAVGEGLSLPLHSFTVPVTSVEMAALRVASGEVGSAKWSLFGLTPLEGYAAALVVARSVRLLRRWRWRGFGASGC